MARSRLAFFCVVAFLLSAAHGFAGDKPVVVTTRLSGFETAEEMAKWQIRASKPATTWELSTDHVRHGKGSAKFTTPSLKQSGQRWPAVVMSGDRLPVRDWSPYDHVVFEAFNPGKKPVPLHFCTYGQGRASWSTRVDLRPGHQTVRVQLGGAARSKRVDEFHFFQNDPPEPYTIYLDELRLETRNLRLVLNDVRQATNAVAKRLRSVALASTLRSGMQWPGAKRKMEELTKGLEALAQEGDPEKLRAWRSGVRELSSQLPGILDAWSLDVFENQFHNRTWGYHWTHGVDKVFRKDWPFLGRISERLQVELAANEYEGVQLVLRSHKPLKGVRVAVSHLRTHDGKLIPSEQVEVLLVGYVNTKKPPYAVDYVGWWPDPLLDFLPTFDLDAEVWQPVWLDVHTAPNQAPGIYDGFVTVTAEGAEPLRVPLRVIVWDFAVPEEYHFPLAVVFWDGMLRSIYSRDAAEWEKYMAYCRGEAELKDMGTGEARRLVEVRRKSHDLILAHHLIPDCIYRGHPPRIDDVRRWKAEGARWFNIIHISSVGSLKAGQPYPADRKKRILDVLADYVPRLEKEGLLDMAYIYGFDEIRANQFAAVKDIFGEIKKRYPTIPLMTTAYDHSYGTKTGLDPYVDIWVPLTPKFAATSGAIAAARQRGRQVWWYICCGPHHPYANWFVEYAAAEHRLIMGFMPHKFRSEGFLHYSMNFWRTNRRVKTKDGKTVVRRNAPFAEPINRGPLTNSDGKSWTDYNGDGLIFYPGPNGPIPTIRMKCIRDGLEDYEYLWLLKRIVSEVRAGKRRAPADWLKRAETALAVHPSLVRTLTDYSTDGADLLAGRRAIARLLTGTEP